MYSNLGRFLLTPSSLTVAVEQRVASFKCVYTDLNAVNIDWRVNGTLLSRRGLSNVTANTQLTDGVVTSVLSVGTLLEYNNSRIQCVGSSSDGRSFVATFFLNPPVKLHIQGFIHIVLQ